MPFSFHPWLLLQATATLALQRPVAIVTGGTRGIGSGISTALAEAGYDLLLTYNTNQDAAHAFASQLQEQTPDLCVECVGGDISLAATRQAIFDCLDTQFAAKDDDDSTTTTRLQVLVHNAGQYVGVTSDNSDGLEAGTHGLLQFGNGSLRQGDQDEATNFDTMHYYQRMYGEAFVDLCERALVRLRQNHKSSDKAGHGAIVGISSPGVTAALYGPDRSYSMPGAGKCLMEYAMRIYAVEAASIGVTVNVVIPGLVETDAWQRLAQSKGMPDATALMAGVLERGPPLKQILQPRDLGNVVAFLCSSAGRFITGMVLPSDGGLHLVR